MLWALHNRAVAADQAEPVIPARPSFMRFLSCPCGRTRAKSQIVHATTIGTNRVKVKVGMANAHNMLCYVFYQRRRATA